jgi:hypothetical protein
MALAAGSLVAVDQPHLLVYFLHGPQVWVLRLVVAGADERQQQED